MTKRLAQAVVFPPVYVSWVGGERPVWLHINHMQHYTELTVEDALDALYELAAVMGLEVYDPTVHGRGAAQ
ncbi:hypothetical protein ACH4FX_02975 [Streptomyces sp. NPDC018019]|uniref:hypothetical protein n=1 Tax=Streptomyces sp. NPDC018019 TaxID=3365030 RepID=UPI0037B6CC9E